MTKEGHIEQVVDGGEAYDRVLIRRMLELSPAERLRSVAAYWPLIRIGLERRSRPVQREAMSSAGQPASAKPPPRCFDPERIEQFAGRHETARPLPAMYVRRDELRRLTP